MGVAKGGGNVSKSGPTTRGGEHSGPRSGKNAPKKVTPKRGKPKMTAAAWSKLTAREKQQDYNGTRFKSVTVRAGRGQSERS